MTSQAYIRGYLCEDKGFWVVRARITDPMSGKRKLLSKSTGFKVSGNNKRKAEAKMHEIVCSWEQQFKTGKYTDQKVTFKECVFEWIESKRLVIKENTLKSYKVTINAYLIPKLGDIKMCDLSRQHIQRYFQELNGVVSPNTMKKHRALIHSIVENAYLNGIIQNNVVVNIELPKIQKHESKALDEAELKHLIKKVENESEPTKSIILLGVCYGLRRSEICGLRWSDIDFSQKLMHIRNTVTDYSGLTIEREQTKTNSSRRDIVLISNTIPYLESLKSKSNSDKVCAYPNGRTPRPDTVSALAVKFLSSCGLSGVTLHGLRHTAASILARKLSPKSVQEYLGHSDIQTTLNIYTHLTISDKMNTSETMSSIIENL